jgi:hypothetical protein
MVTQTLWSKRLAVMPMMQQQTATGSGHLLQRMHDQQQWGVTYQACPTASQAHRHQGQQYQPYNS